MADATSVYQHRQTLSFDGVNLDKKSDIAAQPHQVAIHYPVISATGRHYYRETSTMFPVPLCSDIFVAV